PAFRPKADEGALDGPSEGRRHAHGSSGPGARSGYDLVRVLVQLHDKGGRCFPDTPGAGERFPGSEKVGCVQPSQSPRTLAIITRTTAASKTERTLRRNMVQCPPAGTVRWEKSGGPRSVRRQLLNGKELLCPPCDCLFP